MVGDAVQSAMHHEAASFVQPGNTSTSEPDNKHVSGVVAQFYFECGCAAFRSNIEFRDRAGNGDRLPWRARLNRYDCFTGVASEMIFGRFTEYAVF